MFIFVYQTNQIIKKNTKNIINLVFVNAYGENQK